MQIGKKEIKQSLFSDDMCRKSQSTQKTLKTQNQNKTKQTAGTNM